MLMVDESRAQTSGTIAVSRTGGRDLDMSGVSIRLPDGSEISGLPPMALHPGDRLMITGPSGSGKSTLFRALAGLWPSGKGRVAFPKDGEVLVMPQRPYFPLGTLRTAVAYPSTADDVPEAEIVAALRAVGLSHLASRLDEEEADWNVMLSGGEQQRIGIARALIRKPTILLFDEPVAALADDSGRELYRTLLEKLPATVVLTIDRREVLREYHPEIVELSRDSASSLPRGGPLATMPA
jgi:putative ATP-binding cassette transporter